jgi:hypothetical protein
MHQLQQIVETFDSFSKVAGFGRPIVHFSVDVDSVFAAPGRIELLVPLALKVSRKRVLTAGGLEEIAAVGEVEGGKRPVVTTADGLS